MYSYSFYDYCFLVPACFLRCLQFTPTLSQLSVALVLQLTTLLVATTRIREKRQRSNERMEAKRPGGYVYTKKGGGDQLVIVLVTQQHIVSSPTLAALQDMNVEQ